MPSFSEGTIWYSIEGWGTWRITAITATQLKYIAHDQQSKSLRNKEFPMDLADFRDRLDRGIYKIGSVRPERHWLPVGAETAQSYFKDLADADARFALKKK